MFVQRTQMMCGPSQADYAGMLANWARTELLKEKVKTRLNEKYGEKLDKLADLIVEVIDENATTEDAQVQREEKLEDAFDELY